MDKVKQLEKIAEAKQGIPLYRYWQIWSKYLKNKMTFSEYATSKLEAYRTKNHKRKPYELPQY